MFIANSVFLDYCVDWNKIATFWCLLLPRCSKVCIDFFQPKTSYFACPDCLDLSECFSISLFFIPSFFSNLLSGLICFLPGPAGSMVFAWKWIQNIPIIKYILLDADSWDNSFHWQGHHPSGALGGKELWIWV